MQVSSYLCLVLFVAELSGDYVDSAIHLAYSLFAKCLSKQRFRRLTCDGQRPSCLRCAETGRVCDGYKATTTSNVTASSLTFEVPGTAQERRAFQFFLRQTGNTIASALELDHLYQFVLQASHIDELLKHTIVSLGSIGERLTINEVLTSDNEQANERHQFARWQYGKALKGLQIRLGAVPEKAGSATFVFCFLFAIFEFLQGNEAGCLTHLRAGIKFLESMDSARSCNGDIMPPVLEALRKEVKRSVLITSDHTALWLGHDTYDSTLLVSNEDPQFSLAPAMLPPFLSLDQASSSLTSLIKETLRFRRALAMSPRTLEVMCQRRQELLTRLRSWHGNFGGLQARLTSSSDCEILGRISIIEMNFTTTLVTLRACLESDEDHQYRQFESNFRQVLSYAKELLPLSDERAVERVQRIFLLNNGLAPPSRKDANAFGLFEFYIGVMPPLFITAVKCQNPSICAEAIALLSSRPWREGAWDSSTLARNAQQRLNMRTSIPYRLQRQENADEQGFFDFFPLWFCSEEKIQRVNTIINH